MHKSVMFVRKQGDRANNSRMLAVSVAMPIYRLKLIFTRWLKAFLWPTPQIHYNKSTDSARSKDEAKTLQIAIFL